MKIYSEEQQCFADMEYQFTVDMIESFHKEILPLLATDKEFVIHCIDLKEIDSTALQALISLKKQVLKDGNKFEISAGTVFKNYISFFKLDEYFKGDII